MDGFLYTLAAAWLIAINGAAFFAFLADKMIAQSGGWRIPEDILLTITFFGGTIGAYAGRALFRHKTRKQPFSGRLHTIAILQVALFAGLLVFFWE